MKKYVGFVFAMFFVLQLFLGCSSIEALGRFTIISSQNVDLGRLSEMTRSGEKFETLKDDLNLKVFFIRTRRVSQSYELENALDSVVSQIPGGVALVNAELSFVEKRGFLGITKRWGYVFEGNVLVDPNIALEDKNKLNDLCDNGTLNAIWSEEVQGLVFVDSVTFNQTVASVK